MRAPQSRLSTASFGEEVSTPKVSPSTMIATDFAPYAMHAATDRATGSNLRPNRIERRGPSTRINPERAADIALALLGLVLSAPLIIVSMIALVLCSPGSPIVAQERVSRRGRRFTALTLRTTKLDARGAPQHFALGAILRASNIDELPNLVNVLFGHLSIV